MRLGSPFRATSPHGALSLIALVVSLASAPATAQLSLLSVSPSSQNISFAGLSALATGTGFTTQSIVQLSGVPVPTYFVSSTMLGFDINPPESTQAGFYNVRVSNPLSISNSVNITLTNPVPSLSSIMPGIFQFGFVAGSGAQNFTLDGGIFASTATVRWNGTPLSSTWLGRTQVMATVPAALLASPGTANITIENPAPGGGTSNPLSLPILAPVISSTTPAVLPLAPSTNTTVLISGSTFQSGGAVYVDGVPSPSAIYIDDFTVRITIPSSLPQAQVRGVLAITIENPGGVLSNTHALPVGGGANQGTHRRAPIAPPVGSTYALLSEGGTPNSIYTMIIDAAARAPVYPWPSSTQDLVLSVRAFAPANGTWFPLVDGIGIYGPPSNASFDTNGAASFPGIPLPNPPLNVDLNVQSVYLDPAAPSGFRLTWARTEEL